MNNSFYGEAQSAFEHKKKLGKRSMAFSTVMILILPKKSNTVFIGINSAINQSINIDLNFYLIKEVSNKLY